ncbi:MAG: DUF2851 family protein [Opitutaceae bacterium]|nr:DUF2851 family protein [Opitutaceae bacterium]
MGAPVTVSSDELAEVQGLYGPFQFPESLLQKIWLRREIDIASAHTQCGRRVEVIHPGRWNRLGGPDFKHARLRLNGVETTGDIELHLRAEDWRHHGHHRDPAYDQVVLHVVLWSGPDPRTEQSAGRSIPTLALLPLLLYPLEEYAADAVVERLADRACTRATEELLTLPDQERRKTLRLHAAARWKQKVSYLKRRIDRLGWTDACHHTALEILGYRHNRAPMFRIAQRWPLNAWQADPSPVAEACAGETGRWSMQGVRPANHPATRLRQYAQWTRAVPDWPALFLDAAAVRALSGIFPADAPVNPETGSRAFRSSTGITRTRAHIFQHWCGAAFGGPRLDTLICNLLLPALSFQSNADGAQALWLHWYAGDLPPHIAQSLRDLDLLSYEQPICHGLVQGLLGWWIDHESSSMKR